MAKACLVLILAIYSWPTSASLMALEVGDWRTPGDAMVVRDDGNRLEWLRLSMTRGASALEIETSYYFDFTGRTGFRWASPGEVSALFRHLSWHTEPVHIFAPAPADMRAEARHFFLLFGGITSGADVWAIAGVSQGMFRLPDGQFLAGTVIVAEGGNPRSGEWNTFVTSAEAEPIDNWTMTMRDPRMGAWLVRRVPEPGTAWLCGAACLLLVRYRPARRCGS